MPSFPTSSDRASGTFAFVRPDASRGLYNRQDWARHAAGDGPNFRGQRSMAPYWLAAIALFDELPRRQRVLHDEDSLVVVDLAEPGAAAAHSPL
jgi:hypothetical protein